MLKRDCKIPESNSFFLFGTRGTGKSTLLRELLKVPPDAYLDLLNIATERALARDPDSLEARIRALTSSPKTIVSMKYSDCR